MKYNKGDTIDFEGTIGLVLNDGIKGKKFAKQYKGQRIVYLDDEGLYFKVNVEPTFAWEVDRNKIRCKQESVWYNILIGDINLWSEERNLSTIKESNYVIH